MQVGRAAACGHRAADSQYHRVRSGFRQRWQRLGYRVRSVVELFRPRHHRGFLGCPRKSPDSWRPSSTSILTGVGSTSRRRLRQTARQLGHRLFAQCVRLRVHRVDQRERRHLAGEFALAAPGDERSSTAGTSLAVTLYPFRQTRRSFEVVYRIPSSYHWPLKNEYTSADIAAAGGTLLYTSNGSDNIPQFTYNATVAGTIDLVAFTTDRPWKLQQGGGSSPWCRRVLTGAGELRQTAQALSSPANSRRSARLPAAVASSASPEGVRSSRGPELGVGRQALLDHVGGRGRTGVARNTTQRDRW